MKATLYQEMFGRDACAHEILGLLMGGTSVALYGDEGVGKSTLLRDVLRRLCEEECGNVVYLSSIRNEKPLWQEMCYQLECDAEEKRIFGSMNTTELCTLAIRTVKYSEERIFLLVDIAGSLPPRTVEGLCSLLSLDVIFLLATCTLTVNKVFMERIECKKEVTGLDQHAAYAYIDHLCEDWIVEDPDVARKTLFAKTDGRPGLINKVLRKHEKEKRLTNEMMENLDHLIVGKTRYMYLPIATIFVGLLMLNRYVARVTSGGRVHYVLGTVGLVTVLMFRLVLYPMLRMKK